MTSEENGLVIIPCPTCKHTGKRWFKSDDIIHKKTNYKQIECRHCSGSGYLERDWVSAVYEQSIGTYITDGFSIESRPIQVRSRRLKASWTLETQSDMCISDELKDILAKEMANSIDREILEMLKGENCNGT